jgi:hypothetical protein
MELSLRLRDLRAKSFPEDKIQNVVDAGLAGVVLGLGLGLGFGFGFGFGLKFGSGLGLGLAVVLCYLVLSFAILYCLVCWCRVLYTVLGYVWLSFS